VKAEGIFTDAGGNLMKIGELGAALGSLAEGQIALLGFDACLMGMAEVCQQIRHSVKLSVGSEDEVPKAGLPYGDILRQVVAQPSLKPTDLAKIMVEKYVGSYAHKKLKVSLTVSDLGSCALLAAAVKELASSLIDGVKEPKMLKAIVKSRTMARISQEQSYVDLGTLCLGLLENTDGKTRGLAGAVLKVLKDNYVVYGRRFPGDGVYESGLSVFFPLSLNAQKERHAESYRRRTLDARVDWNAYRGLSFCREANWDGFIEAFIAEYGAEAGTA
jgi:hypothetical protein